MRFFFLLLPAPPLKKMFRTRDPTADPNADPTPFTISNFDICE